MKKYEITTEEYTAVVKARRATQNKRIARRLQVIELRYEGKTSKEIAEKLDMNWMYISEIVKQFKAQGLEEFARMKYTSHNRKLSYEQEEEILQKCEQKAEEGHITTVEEVRKALNAEIGGTTAGSYVYRVLKRHGWVKKMPRPKHPKSASEEEQADSKKLRLDTMSLEKKSPQNG